MISKDPNQLSAREIDEAVARKLGWEKKERELSGFKNVGPLYVWVRPKDVRDKLPNYSTSIEEAWEILASLVEKGKCIQLNMSDKGVGCWIGNKHFREHFGEADTAPFAICLAFLKLED